MLVLGTDYLFHELQDPPDIDSLGTLSEVPKHSLPHFLQLCFEREDKLNGINLLMTDPDSKKIWEILEIIWGEY